MAAQFDGCVSLSQVTFYPLLKSSEGLYEPFNLVTQKSLLHAGKELGFSINAEQSKTLLAVYDQLQP